MATPDVSVHMEEVVVVTTPDTAVDGSGVEEVKTVLVTTNLSQHGDPLSSRQWIFLQSCWARCSRACALGLGLSMKCWMGQHRSKSRASLGDICSPLHPVPAPPVASELCLGTAQGRVGCWLLSSSIFSALCPACISAPSPF
uniref:Glucocorticoid modulatory element binding protein 2 n=1 Tax=Gallus gallus TaxID=9031 RepID=A0A8V0YVP1_CHICK